jgi:hypothetical protein
MLVSVKPTISRTSSLSVLGFYATGIPKEFVGTRTGIVMETGRCAFALPGLIVMNAVMGCTSAPNLWDWIEADVIVSPWVVVNAPAGTSILKPSRESPAL